jgi:phenylpropionate dioxygenase-like ring-hydroxylating dioxygenase large terminal subunit
VSAVDLREPGAPLDLAAGLRAALAHHWHPVCAADQLPGPVGVRLLGRDLVVARLADDRAGAAGSLGPGPAGAGVGVGGAAGTVVAFGDRCPHRSTRLSAGCVDGGRLRCAYHGWAYGADGRCVEIPAMPGGPIPPAAAVEAFDATVAHGLVWVRFDASVDTEVPACPAFDEPAMRVLAGDPYTWPVGAPRRVENFVDLAHFAWVHDGSLGRRDEPVPPLPALRRASAELRFDYDPPAVPDEPDPAALVGSSRYRMPMPCTVDIEFLLPGGHRRRLWMTASPVDDETCRTFWFVARTDDLDGDDEAHLAFQRLVLAEDEPVVTNQVPGAIPLEAGAEVSVATDRVSIAYRRWLRELARAALDGPDAYALALGLVPQAEEVAS